MYLSSEMINDIFWIGAVLSFLGGVWWMGFKEDEPMVMAVMFGIFVGMAWPFLLAIAIITAPFEALKRYIKYRRRQHESRSYTLKR